MPTEFLGQLECGVLLWIGAEPIATINALELLAVLRRVEELGDLRTASGTLQIGRYVFPNARYSNQDRPMAEIPPWAALTALDTPPVRMTAGVPGNGEDVLDEVLGFRPVTAQVPTGLEGC